MKIEYAWNHFDFNTYKKNRDDIKGGFFETFRDPFFIVTQKREGQELDSVYFYKPYYNEKNQQIDLFGIGLDSDGNVDFKTYYKADNENRLLGILNDENVVIRYKKDF